MTLAPLLALALAASASAAPTGALNDAGSALRSGTAYDGSRAKAGAVFAGEPASKPMPKGMMTAEQAKALSAARRIPVAELMPARWFKDEPAAAAAAVSAAAAEPAPAAPLAPGRYDALADALGGLAGAALGLAFGMGLAYGLSRVAERAA